MNVKKTRLLAGLAVAGLATTGAIALGSTAFADPSATTPTPAASGTAQPSTGAKDAAGGHDMGRQGGQPGQSQDAAVTGDEATKVIDAVKAKDGSTITEVRKDPDGSYDALGTKADGTKVMYDVSADLATITEATGGPGGMGRHGGQPGQPGQSQDAAVTSDEATKVIDAVKAKDGSTITEVRKDPDGSYDALGTKADGTKVMYDVSADLATITEAAGR